MKKTCAAIIPLAIAALMLAACKVEHVSRIKHSQTVAPIAEIDSTIRVEVTSCTDHEDKTQASRDVLKARDIMSKLWSDGVFEGCRNENMESFASFTVPLEVGTISPGEKFKPKGAAFVRNGAGETFFMLAPHVREQIKKSRESSSTMAVSIEIHLVNNSGAPLKVKPIAAFVNGTPFAELPRWDNWSQIPPNAKGTIKLSDVSTERIIRNGVAPVYAEISEPDAVKK